MPTLNPDDYKVADLNLASFGRKEIQLAEHEMSQQRTDNANAHDGAHAQDQRGRVRLRPHAQSGHDDYRPDEAGAQQQDDGHHVDPVDDPQDRQNPTSEWQRVPPG